MAGTEAATTWRIRLPTAPPRESAGAPSYVLSRPLAGSRVGMRHEGSWRSWMLIIEQWQAFLRRDGAEPVVLAAGGRVGEEGERTRAAVRDWAADIDCGIAGLGTCGSCTSNSVADAVALEAAGKPAVVAVCDEFAQHAANMARFLGHPALKMLVLPYPLEARPAGELQQLAADYYPEFLRLLAVP